MAHASRLGRFFGSGLKSFVCTIDAPFSGSGSFTVSGGGSVSERGNLWTADSALSNYEMSGPGSWVLEGGSGTGALGGSTLLSYSGSGAFTDPYGTSGVAFFIPGSGSATISDAVSGTAWASGQVATTSTGTWTLIEASGGSWNTSGTAAVLSNLNNNASYAASSGRAGPVMRPKTGPTIGGCYATGFLFRSPN